MIIASILLTIFMISMIVYSLCRLPSRAYGHLCDKSLIFDKRDDARHFAELLANGDAESSVDTLNILNDGSGANDIGTLTSTNLFLTGMGGDLSLPDTHGRTHSFEGGINYLNVETLELMLGRGDNHLTIDSTMTSTDGTRDPMTIVHGGGGSDHILINGGGGSASPLVVFGDTSQDGSRYSGVSGYASADAFAFNNPGNDEIDAQNATQNVVIYGGRGNDVIWGSQSGDQIAGGSGNDEIHGQGGDDLIYGDSGFNIVKETISIPDPNQDSGVIDRTLYVRKLVVMTDVNPNALLTADTLTPGKDQIFGDAGNNILNGNARTIDERVSADQCMDGRRQVARHF